MPKVPMDYSRTIIYKIVCRDLSITNCYVGHTTDFIKRKYNHKSTCKTDPSYLYQFIREHGDWNNWDMIMIESYPCNDKNEARKRERYWIETLNANLNIYSAYSSLSSTERSREYRIKNEEKHTKYQTEYYIKNIDWIKERKSMMNCCILCRREIRKDYLNEHYKRVHN
jgi:hypothetical protein